LSIEQTAGKTGKSQVKGAPDTGPFKPMITGAANCRWSTKAAGNGVNMKNEINIGAADKCTIKVYIQRTAHQDGSFNRLPASGM
jgi:hypothetical protein